MAADDYELSTHPDHIPRTVKELKRLRDIALEIDRAQDISEESKKMAEESKKPEELKYVAGLKDSGTRKDFGAGAQKEGSQSEYIRKGAYHLAPIYPDRRVNGIYAKGSIKYAPRNWEKGIPLAALANSAMHHWNQFWDGEIDEDHLHQCIWNLKGISETIRRINMGELPATLNDMPGHTCNPEKYRAPGPACALDDENDREKREALQALKGKSEEEAFGRKLTKEERFIPFVYTDKPEDF